MKTLPPYRDSEVKVPDGHAWLEGTVRECAWFEVADCSTGDEAFKTEDSNTLGPVSTFPSVSGTHCPIYDCQIPLGLIDSRAHAIFWPPGRFGRILTPDLAKEQERRNERDRGPAWRKEMAEFERERKRQARININITPSALS